MKLLILHLIAFYVMHALIAGFLNDTRTGSVRLALKVTNVKYRLYHEVEVYAIYTPRAAGPRL